MVESELFIFWVVRSLCTVPRDLHSTEELLTKGTQVCTVASYVGFTTVHFVHVHCAMVAKWSPNLPRFRMLCADTHTHLSLVVMFGVEPFRMVPFLGQLSAPTVPGAFSFCGILCKGHEPSWFLSLTHGSCDWTAIF